MFTVLKKIKTYLLKKKTAGVVLIEAAIAIPVVVYVMFFCFELVRIHFIKIALDSIALHCSLDFIASKEVTNFDSIIAKHSAAGFNKNRLKYYFKVYDKLEEMCANDKAPFGADEVFWPDSNTSTTGTYIDANSDNSHNSTSATATLSVNAAPAVTYLSGKFFVLTFVYDFVFSGGLLKKFFRNGSNTKNGSKFLLWGRGAGVCD